MKTNPLIASSYSHRHQLLSSRVGSMSKTQSKYWIFGLPENGKISVYAMYASQLRDFALQYVRSHPESMKRVGEFGGYCTMIKKSVFISQPFISKFGSIEIPAA